MGLNCFNYKMGTSQGRMGKGGEFAFVLGENDFGPAHYLANGDYAEVVQDTDLTNINIIRAFAKIEIPDAAPSEANWEISITINNIPYAVASCAPGRVRSLTDFAANVSKLSGVHTVGVRLSLSSPTMNHA